MSRYPGGIPQLRPALLSLRIRSALPRHATLVFGAIAVAVAGPVRAGCDELAPVAGQQVTCTPAAPNPEGTPVAANGAADIGVLVETGAQLQPDAGGSAISLIGAGGHRVRNLGTISTPNGSAVQLGAGSTVENSGSISSGNAAAVQFIGAGASTLVNTGSIAGATGVLFGNGNDTLDMRAGTITGGVQQGDGDDTLLLGGGTLDGVDQGNGADTMTVTGGSVTGAVQQGNGQDVFTISDGTVGALLQGDATDRFLMTGGRIIGGFDDGDFAEQTGGRIGRVNMKLENNTYLMSGGSIDGNLVAGFGNDTIVLSDGYIGGNISISGGDDSVTLTGGTVRGEIRLSFGNDRLDWSDGGVVYGLIDLGEGDDSVRLANLNQSFLGAVPGFDAGPGMDTLLMENVKTTGVGRFNGWEQIALHDDTQLTFDGALVLGDAGSSSGTLDIDATSALFASGTANSIAAFAAGAFATVNNAGRIDLGSNATAGDVFTIAGHYIGNGGALYLDTVLGDDSSASDRLVISGGSASGTTGIGVRNAGGGGAETVADGILLVQALNGATTAPGAFALFNPISVGAYEYFLFKGGVSAGTGENWYLRSTLVASATPAPAPSPGAPPPAGPEPPPPEDLGTPPPALPPAPPPPPDVDPPDDPDPTAPEPAPPPEPPAPDPVPPPADDTPPPVPDAVAVLPGPLAAPPTPGASAPRGEVVPIYRLETPAYAVVPSLLRTVTQASLGTFHERQGEQRLLVGLDTRRAAWGRLIGSSEEQQWQGDALAGFDGDLQGLQAGVDLYSDVGVGLRSQWGLFVGRTRATGRLSGLALGWENVHVGQARLDDKHVGLSWTGVGSAGGYVDAVVMQSRYRGQAGSTRGLGIDVRGDGTSASLEAGKPLLRFGQSSWWLEPQVQVIWQRQSLADAADPVAAIHFDADNAWTGRIGVRVAADHGLPDNGWQPYFKLDYWKTLDGDNRIDFDSNRIIAGQETSAWEVGVGVVGRFNRNVSAYAVADYTRDLEDRDRRRRGIEGNIGLRLDW